MFDVPPLICSLEETTHANGFHLWQIDLMQYKKNPAHDCTTHCDLYLFNFIE